MSVPYEAKAATALEQLGLDVAGRHLDSVSQRAAAEQWSYSHFLGYLLDGEIIARHEHTVRINLQFSRLPYIKRIDTFDFAVQASVDRRMVDELVTGRFLAEGRNVVFLGPPGVGKTHLVACKGSFGTSDAVLHVDVTPANRTWLVVVARDVGHQLAA